MVESVTGEGMIVAAVDLGSNSFHMVIARSQEHDLLLVDRLKETVRLAQGLDESGALSPESMDRAVACLQRFGQRLRGIPGERVRVVGTNTMRQARNAGGFRERAEAALGHPIEVISGSEEARLIYLGVAHSLNGEKGNRLVVDIGGGSTEVIVGEGFEVLRPHSLFMGCVTYSRRFFPKGVLDRESFRAAETAARLELEPIQKAMRTLGWKAAVGASGTVNAIQSILAVNNFTDGSVTLAGMKLLRKSMMSAGHVDGFRMEGLKADRAPVLAGGLAILMAIFRGLKVEAMKASSGALREGALYDLLGRIRHEDVRERTIRRLVEQYRVDVHQADQIEATALALFKPLGPAWELPKGASRNMLSWAARLHEIGLTVSHTGYHKHSAYLVQHSDMPGFSADDQRLLAALIGSHRRKIQRTHFAELSADATRRAERLSAIFRLAFVLNRGRTPEATRLPKASADSQRIKLKFPEGWLAGHPLTAADLEAEKSALRSLGIELRVRENGTPR